MNRSDIDRVHQAARIMVPGLTRLSTATAPMATRGFQNPDTMRGAPTQRRADDNDQRPDPGDDDDQVSRPDDENDQTDPADTLDEPTRPDDDNTMDDDDDRDDEDYGTKTKKRAR